MSWTVEDSKGIPNLIWMLLNCHIPPQEYDYFSTDYFTGLFCNHGIRGETIAFINTCRDEVCLFFLIKELSTVYFFKIISIIPVY